MFIIANSPYVHMGHTVTVYDVVNVYAGTIMSA